MRSTSTPFPGKILCRLDLWARQGRIALSYLGLLGARGLSAKEPSLDASLLPLGDTTWGFWMSNVLGTLYVAAREV